MGDKASLSSRAGWQLSGVLGRRVHLTARCGSDGGPGLSGSAATLLTFGQRFLGSWVSNRRELTRSQRSLLLMQNLAIGKTGDTGPESI